MESLVETCLCYGYSEEESTCDRIEFLQETFDAAPVEDSPIPPEKRLDEASRIFLQHTFFALMKLFMQALRQKREPETLTAEKIVQAIIRLLSFRPHDHGEPGSSTGSAFEGNPPYFLPTPSSTTANSNSGRRKRNEDRHDGEKTSQKKGTSSKNNSQEPRLKWACHFHVFDRRRFHVCSRYRLARIVDVRQHLNRSHSQQAYCPTCGLGFPNDRLGVARDAHIRMQTCQRVQFTPQLGASRDQLDDIRTVAADSRQRTDEERWFEIWDILFPDTPRPRSAYPSQMQTEAVREHSQRFLEVDMPGFVRGFLASTGNGELSHYQLRLETLMREGLQLFVASFEQEEGFRHSNTPHHGNNMQITARPAVTQISMFGRARVSEPDYDNFSIAAGNHVFAPTLVPAGVPFPAWPEQTVNIFPAAMAHGIPTVDIYPALFDHVTLLPSADEINGNELTEFDEPNEVNDLAPGRYFFRPP